MPTPRATVSTWATVTHRRLPRKPPSRAPGEAPAPVGDHSHVVRLDHDGWAWDVSGREPLDEPSARHVVEQVRYERLRPVGA